MRVKLSKEQKIQVLNSIDVYDVMQRILRRENKIDRRKEHFWVVCLSFSNSILLIELVRKAKRFWHSRKRDELARNIGLSIASRVFRGATDFPFLQQLLSFQQSAYYLGPVEGLIVRKESELWLEDRAKLVQSDFAQTITEHWRARKIEWNRLQSDASTGRNALKHR
jgi:hypothetical protein